MMKVTGGHIFCVKYCRDVLSLYTRKSAFSEGKNGVSGLNFQRRGRSYAASAPSQTPEPPYGRKKVSKDERFAMVESFVKTYKSSHGGKLPTASLLRKEVGGSYYSIRKMLQELDYKSKICSPVNETKDLPETEVLVEGGSFAECEVLSTAVGAQEDTQISAVGDELEAEGESKAHASVETALAQASGGNILKDGIVEDALHHPSDVLLTEIHQFKDKSEEAYDQPLEVAEDDRIEEIEGVQEKTIRGDYDYVSEKGNLLDGDNKSNELSKDDVIVDVKEQTEKDGLETKLKEKNSSNFEDRKQQVVSQNLVDTGREEVEANHHNQSPEKEKSLKNITSQQPTGTEHNKSTFWGSLKSLADDIVNIWRKR